ncbi:MAG: SMC-Scp complex subunit ScpB [Lysobacterales bacterium]|nr:MAG: SMC-Scp complex subunit ScpB [Xanthomonadales bacterium]
MSEQPLSVVLEAVLLAAGRPVTVEQMLELWEETQRPTPEAVREALAELEAACAGRAYEVRQVSSGWRVQVRPVFADVVSRLWQERPSRYSRALLETLALIAYRQPITRGEIEDIRGVTVSTTIMRTLHERNWVRVVGHREVPGRPELLGTTREFLDYFGLKSLDDLPTLAELRDLDDIKVQLEFPGGAPVPAIERLALAAPEDESLDEPSDSTEADDDDHEPQLPTLVAGPQDSQER